MALRIGINGFGRIGRMVFRVMKEKGGFEVVAINDLSDAATLASLLKYDTVFGRFAGEVGSSDGKIIVDGKAIMQDADLSTEIEEGARLLEDLPWHHAFGFPLLEVG